jgi:predicted amidophosphoribosyltransferase
VPLVLFPDPNRCPSCGERVTPYAAGCALCGADLDPRRWQPRPSLVQQLRARLARAREG